MARGSAASLPPKLSLQSAARILGRVDVDTTWFSWVIALGLDGIILACQQFFIVPTSIAIIWYILSIHILSCVIPW